MSKSETTYLTKEQILNSRAAYPEGKESGDPSSRMKEFHDALCDMAIECLHLRRIFVELAHD